MDLELLLHDISVVKGDVLMLQRDVDVLTDEEAILREEIERLERELDETTENSDRIPKGFTKSKFDVSIAKFFDNSTPNVPNDALKQDFSSISSRAEFIVETKENILYENVFRLSGITAFPINGMENEEIFGIRFDNFDANKKVFNSPHYVVLRRIDITSKDETTKTVWLVFKHTLPVYIPYKELEQTLQNSQNSDDDIFEFATSIRRSLVSIQYKHDKLNSLLSFESVLKIDKDLQAERVLIDIKSNASIPHQIELICSENLIEVVNATLHKQPRDLSLSIEALLKDTPFKDLKKNFRKVVDQLK